MNFRKCFNFVPLFLQPSEEQLLAFAQRRRDICQSPLVMKCNDWNENHLLDPLGSALRDANIQLIPYGDFVSVMD